ncbi:MAG: thiamine pyrophosphokinase [candidate division Zixibacteria bacterium]|nr:thiamine pyrophosphokinase [candidate division Zixibacteria bacterium]
MKTKAVIFLNGSYPDNHKQFYIDEYHDRKNGSVVIAADGGLRFFVGNSLKPDVIAGDMDSIDSDNIAKFPEAVIVEVSTEGKSLTDGELALDWCAGNNITDVTLYGGIDTSFETDHLLGNIFMMFGFLDRSKVGARGRTPTTDVDAYGRTPTTNNFPQDVARSILGDRKIRMRDYCQEIIPLEDDEYTGEGKPGDMLSVIPLSDEIVYEADGLKYNPGGRVYKFGQTTPLRNELADSRFRVSIKGRAVVIRNYL